MIGEEVRRLEDGELLGFVRHDPTRGEWWALTVFGAAFATAATREAARSIVVNDGLAAISKRWFHRAADTTEWRVVVLTETWPGRARGMIGLYPLPGFPPFEISADDLAAGDEMTLEPPDDADLSDFTLPR